MKITVRSIEGNNKIRFLTTNNKSGDAVGITLPISTLNTFPIGTYFNIVIDERGIHLLSGCNISKHEIRKYNRDQQPYAY